VLNLGLGASYSWEARPERLTLAEAAYARAVCGMASVTTVRDAVAASLLRSADVVARVLPCPALFAIPAPPADVPARQTVLVNYMRLAGHYDGAQNIDEAAWRQEVRRLLAILSRNGVDHLFATVGNSERDLAERHFPQSPRVTLSSLTEIEAAARHVSFAVVNRLHIAIPLAGAGIPSVMVGNDCRMKAMEPLGLDLMYVKDATADALYEAVERGLRNAHARERLLELRRGAERDYLALLREATGW
jgi:polysaccharide pyruvyl transferase WcaK-like protein